MEINGLVEQYLAEIVPPQLLSMSLPDDIAANVIDHLKNEADRYWAIDPNHSLDLSNRIVRIGKQRRDIGQMALGVMARGDALKFLGKYKEAWKLLDLAGRMFESAGDEVGWARTRIGRLWLGLKLNHINEVLTDAERARAILLQHGEQEKLLRLELNTAYIHTQRGDQQQSLRLYQAALEAAEALGEAGLQHLGMIYMNIGFVYEALGDFPRALFNYEKARELHRARDEKRNMVNVELNIANIAQTQGHYRHALRLLYDMLEYGLDQFPEEEKAVKRALIACFLHLNRYAEARDMAQEIVEKYRSQQATYDMARTLLHMTTAEAELHNFSAAETAINEAERLFNLLGSTAWTMVARLRHGQVAVHQGNLEVARQEADIVANYFQQEGLQFHQATANLLLGQISLASQDLSSALQMGRHVLEFSQRYNVPSLRYAAHVLLGHVARAESQSTRAIRRYQAAAATIERVQRGLTITLRSGFLENKNEAGRELVKLYLGLGKAECAFEALERAKSQILLSYVADREQFHWIEDDPESQALLTELETLRDEHQWFYRLAREIHQDSQQKTVVSPEKALEESKSRERRMRAITEQLYLHSRDSQWAGDTFGIVTKDIHQSLDGSSLLIEYYNDGEHLWAFVLDGNNITTHALSATAELVDQLIRQLQMNILTALKLEPHAPSAQRLTQLGRRLLRRLHSLLLEPLALQEYDRRRLMIVPYGALHYLPFNLLFDGVSYLIERFEIVILPAASLAIRPAPRRRPGALVMSHSWYGRLPNTQTEAQFIHQLFGGTLCVEEAASRAALERVPTQILHIAAHGQHRLDQPDLSYIELADGQVYADDLLQQDLSYELVTLSACETGLANVAADEELIGIGRGLLYAGAGALVLSLWQVADSSTVGLMEHLYRALQAGKSKAAALREAQLALLSHDRELHPALWGPFQLVGDAGPLSTIHE